MTSTAPATLDLQQAAREHLWLHFTRMGGYRDAEVPIIVRGDGCYLEDSNGKRYLDALAGLFSVNIGYGFGEEMGEAAAAQMRELPFYTNWSYAHPRAIELASEIASLTPGDLNRVFFVSGGSEAVESAWKLARQYYAARGQQRIRAAIAPAGAEAPTRVDEAQAIPSSTQRRWKAVSRHVAYHGTTMGALSINGIPALREPFEPLVPEVVHVRNTNRYHRPAEETEAEFTAFLLDELEHTIEATGPETIAMVIMEPVQNAGGAFTPPEGYWRGVRELCNRYDILLCADEVITGFGRLGAWFGSELYDIKPDLMTIAKGLSSSYAAIGAVVADDRVMEPFMQDPNMYSHGITFGGHPVQAAVALKNIEIMKRERIVEHVAETQDAFRATLAQLLELPIVGDIRGTGFFYAVELVKDKETRETFDSEECETLLRGFLSPRLFEKGLICRADDRGDPVVQISPPLIAQAGAIRRARWHPGRRARRSLEPDVPMTVADEREAERAVASQPADVRLVEVTKRFDDVVAVDNLSLEIERGSFFALLGPSGCGKTTTLRMIGGFEQPTEGAIYLGDREVSGLPGLQARRQHGLPVLRAVPAPLGVRERGLRPTAAVGARRHAARPGRRDAPHRRPRGHGEAKAAAALGRAAAARRARARAREQAAGALARRAARRTRPEAAQADAARAEGDPARRRHHLHPRHARPGGGHDDGRPDRGHERRADRAARNPDRALRNACNGVCGRLPRRVEPHSRHGHGRRLGSSSQRPGGARTG